MDFQYLFDIVLRRKWLVVLAGLIPAIATFVFISFQDKSYKSAALISNGIVGSGLNLEDNTRGYVQDVMIGMDFGTRLETMKGQSLKRLLAYQMLLHDLSGAEEPFRTIEKMDELDATQADIDQLLLAIQPRLDSLNIDVLPRSQEKVFKELCEELDYNYKAFDKEIVAYRRGDTDFIAAEYESEDPYLSAYLVNKLADIFLKFSRLQQDSEYVESNEFAQQKASEKRGILDAKKNRLSIYKQARTVVDLETQSQGVVERIQELETELEKERTLLLTAETTINDINRIKQRNESNKKNREFSDLIDRDEIVQLREQKKKFDLLYIETQDEEYKTQAELTQRQLYIYIERNANREVEEVDDYTVDINKSLDEKLIKWEIEKKYI